MGKQHKYNVGDQIIVQIAAATENGGKPAYRIKGIENIKFSEGGVDAMNSKGVKPGDIAYEVIIDFDDNELVYDRQEAEELVKRLSEKYNYPVIREGLLKEEGNNGKTV